ncbi:hypothetical protein C8R44DRAFT_882232 [Mycena epipterygia]|nr:hypothetical protein C8R44DRAFT_882232 [Mycena epipterygia]
MERGRFHGATTPDFFSPDLATPPAKEHLKTLYSGLLTVLGIAKEAASNAGVPGLVIGITGLQSLLDAIQKTSQNADDVEDLLKHLKRLAEVLDNAKKRGSISLNRIAL